MIIMNNMKFYKVKMIISYYSFFEKILTDKE
jgi:hypothetical protein